MKLTDDYYVQPNGACRRLSVDMDGRYWENGAEVKEALTVCRQAGPHPHYRSPNPLMPSTWTPRMPSWHDPRKKP